MRSEEEIRKYLERLEKYQADIGQDHWEFGNTWIMIHKLKWVLGEE